MRRAPEAGRCRSSARCGSRTPRRRALSGRRLTSTGGGARRPARPISGFPIFFSTRTANHAFTFALPLNFYWRHDDDANLLVLPLFYDNSHKTGYSAPDLARVHPPQRTRVQPLGGLALLVGRRREGALELPRPLPAGVGLPRKGRRLHGRLPAGLELSRPDLEHDGGRAVPARPRGHLVLSTRCSRSGGAAATKRRGAPTACSSRFFYWDRAEHGLASHLVTPLGGYSRDDRDGTRTWVAAPVPLLRPPRSRAASERCSRRST